MKRPQEHEYTSHVAYSRALEAYCDLLEQPAQDEPKREWVGLTDEDHRQIMREAAESVVVFGAVMRLTEAKLREKNT